MLSATEAVRSLISLTIWIENCALGAGLLDQLREHVVDVVAGVGVRDLVGVLRHRAVHAAQVGRAGADVDDEHVVEHVEAVGDRERLASRASPSPPTRARPR